MSENNPQSGKTLKVVQKVIIPILTAVIPLVVIVIEKCDDWDWCRELNADSTSAALVAEITDVPTEAVVPSPTSPPAAEAVTDMIVFVSQRDGDNDIYAMEVFVDEGGWLVAGVPVKLTDNSASDTYPAWSPDGAKIAFQSDQDGDYDIYFMDVNNRRITALTYNSGFDSSPAWSPDGSQIAYHSSIDGDRDIYLMSANGQMLKNLTANDGIQDYSPTWSPDGSQIAFYSDRDGVFEIYVMDAGGGIAKRMTFIGGEDPAWSPDGTRILFASCADEDSDGMKKCDLYTVTTDGSHSIECLLCDPSVSDMRPSWSPDGSMILFDSNRGGSWDIFAMDADGGHLQALTSNDTWDGIPVWKP
jgi:Tol biopolymer transport system component